MDPRHGYMPTSDICVDKEVGHVMQQQSSEALWQQKSFQWTTIL